MRRAARHAGLALGFTLAASTSASAAPHYDPETADQVVLDARKADLDAFCASPPPTLAFSPGALRLCPLASSVPGCEKLVAACDKATAKPEPPKWNLAWLGDAGAAFLRTAMWFLVAAVPLWLLWLVLDATLRRRKDEKLADKPSKPALVTPTMDDAAHALAAITDAEKLLAMAEEHAARGQLDHAAALYLAASLAALDRRGAIRLARHRTNGEYVRACKDDAARPELRAIVREVDRLQFGKQTPTAEGVAAVGTRATSIVRAMTAAAVMATAALFLAGCGDFGAAGGASTMPPDGDALFLALLERQGATVARPDHALATLPIPLPGDRDTPALVVDATRTILEPDAQLHLMRWVNAGGRLLLFGGVGSWPEELGAHAHVATSTDVKMRFALGDDEPDDDDEDDGYAIFAARVARPASVRWKGVDAVFGSTGDGADYAGVRILGRGLVVGVASDDLITNVGIASPPNAKAVTALIARYAGGRAIQVARPEDGVSPPSGPVAALVKAGLGLAVGHAAAFAALLLVAFGVRQARAKTTPLPARRAWTEHVAATGTLYARAKLAPHALATYAKFVEGRLRARMPRGMTDPAAFLALRSGEDAGHCSEVWARATASRPGDRVQGDELATLGELRALYAAAVKTE